MNPKITAAILLLIIGLLCSCPSGTAATNRCEERFKNQRNKIQLSKGLPVLVNRENTAAFEAVDLSALYNRLKQFDSTLEPQFIIRKYYPAVVSENDSHKEIEVSHQ